MVTVHTPGEALRQAAASVRLGGHVAPRGLATREVLDWSVLIVRPNLLITHHDDRPNLNPAIALYEGCQLVGGVPEPDLPDMLSLGAVGRFRDHGVFEGSYAARSYGLLGRIVDQLTRDRETRQAVVPIFHREDTLRADTKDVPCTLSLQFMVRDNRLRMRTSMRSNDVWWGLPYDLGQFAMLQAAVAQALGIEVGPMYHTVGSLHAYADQMDKVEALALGTGEAEYLKIEWGGNDWASVARRARALLHRQGVQRPMTLMERRAAWVFMQRTERV